MFRNLVIVCLALLLLPQFVSAQENAIDLPPLEIDSDYANQLPPTEYYRASIVSAENNEQEYFDGSAQLFQDLVVRVTTGPNAGEQLSIDHGKMFSIDESQLVEVGDEVIIAKNYKVDGSTFWSVIDQYRLNKIWFLLGLFFLLVISVARVRGLMSFLGLIVSMLLISLILVPGIIAGKDPIVLSLVTSIGIVFLSIYLAHGFNRQTTIAIVATILTLSLAVILSILVVNILGLSGAGSEEAYNLQFGLQEIDLRGLLLGGIIIGTLGVLDDITTSQTAAVIEIHRANQTLSIKELISRGMAVGREHISSLVNTLVLAYAGASLSVLVFISLSQLPGWVLLNSQFAVEEIVRSLVGSSALIIAVPISTWLAATATQRLNLTRYSRA